MSNNDPSNRPGGVHGASTVTPLGEGKKKGGLAWLWPLLGLLLLLALLFLMLRSCDSDDEQTTTTAAQSEAAAPVATGPAAPVAPTTPALPVEAVALPGGQSVQLQPQTLNYELQRFLASPEPAPRTFAFENLNFATGSAELPADAQATVGALAQIMQAYPNARARVVGYADARGAEGANAQLGAQRAESVVRALIAAGVPADRATAASGGENDPQATNATAQGMAENRRTELTVTAK
jgi:outer membrane protein OmpA-like peptidoglycan-associated protein